MIVGCGWNPPPVAASAHRRDRRGHGDASPAHDRPPSRPDVRTPTSTTIWTKSRGHFRRCDRPEAAPPRRLSRSDTMTGGASGGMTRQPPSIYSCSNLDHGYWTLRHLEEQYDAQHRSLPTRDPRCYNGVVIHWWSCSRCSRRTQFLANDASSGESICHS